jgi:hypothetical protein
MKDESCWAFATRYGRWNEKTKQCRMFLPLNKIRQILAPIERSAAVLCV